MEKAVEMAIEKIAQLKLNIENINKFENNTVNSNPCVSVIITSV